MGVNDRYHPNTEGNMRVDLPDYVAARDRFLQDFRFLILNYFDGSARILKRYVQGTHSGLTFKLKADLRRGYHDDTGQWIVKAASPSGTTIDLTLAASQTNYVISRPRITKGDLQTRAFFDTDIGVTGEEYFDDINVKMFIEENVYVDMYPNPDGILLFTIVTDSSSIVSVVDNQDTFFKRRSYSLPAYATRSAMWDLTPDLRTWIDALSAIIGEMKDTSSYVESVPWSNIRRLREFQNLFISGGGNIGFETDFAGSNNLSWSGSLAIELAGRSSSYTVDPATVAITNGQCAYIKLPDGVPGGSLAVTVSSLSSVPVAPGSVGFDPGIIVLFFRRGSTIYGMMDIPELDSGETGHIGVDLPNAIRARLGIISETGFEAYVNTYVIDAIDNYPTAISKLDAKIQWMIENVAKEELIVLPSDTDTVNATAMVWGADVDDVDISVFVNKLPQTQDKAGGLDEDFRKRSGSQLQFSYTLKAGWEVRIRDERTGSRAPGDAQLYQPTLVKEVPSGVKNGSNKVFTLTQDPVGSPYVIVSLDRGLSEGWTLQNDNEIHFDEAPTESQYLEVYYFIPSGGGGGGSGDLSAVAQDIIPDISGLRSLGTAAKAWKNLYLQDQVTSEIYRVRIINGVLDIESV